MLHCMQYKKVLESACILTTLPGDCFPSPVILSYPRAFLFFKKSQTIGISGTFVFPSYLIARVCRDITGQAVFYPESHGA